MATITVTTLDDVVADGDSKISLREALAAANGDTTVDGVTGAGADTITFAAGLSGGTITLDSTLDVTSAVTFDGDLDNDGVADITLSGDMDGIDGQSSGDVKIMYVSGPGVTIDGLVFSGGRDTQHGGAVEAGITPLTIKDSVFVGNFARFGGGAISTNSSLTIIDSTFENNSTTSTGGALELEGISPSLTVINTTFSGNEALQGGAVYLNGGPTSTATLTNVTVAENQATYGGAISNVNAAFEIINSTISANVTSVGTALDLVGYNGAETHLANTVIAGNAGGDIGLDGGGSSLFVSDGGNFIGDGQGLLTDGVNGDQVGTSAAPLDPKLGELADNGGLVETMRPDNDSPLIDAGSNGLLPTDGKDIDGDANTAEALPLDAAGQRRVQSSSVDIGAFEVTPNVAPMIKVQGTLDLALITAGDFQAWAGVGNGTFTPGLFGPFPVLSPTAFTLGDLNGDGALDALVTSGGPVDQITVLLGTGLGQFFPGPPPLPGQIGDEPSAIAVGDLNGDGKLDAIVANSAADTISVLLGNGDGGFITPSTTLSVGDNPQDLALADLNGDGKLDAVVANSGANNLNVLLGNGDGTFVAAPTPTVATGVTPVSVAVEDLNGDGNLDAVVGNRGSADVSVLLGNGAGGFTSALPYPVSVAVEDVALGDFDGNGDLDIVVVGAFGFMGRAYGNGAGGFSGFFGVGVGGTFTTVSLGDLNGDSMPDALASNTDGQAQYALFVSTPTFSIATAATVPGITSLTVGDLNNARLTNEDTAIVFNAVHSNAITLADADSAGLDETLTLTVEHGTLKLASAVGLSVSGNESATVTLTGSIAELNAAFNGLEYRPALDYAGKDKLTIALDDNGNDGSGGAKTATSIVPIIVNAVADPAATTPAGLSTNEDTALAIAGFSVSDTDSTTLTVTLTAASTLTLSQLTGLSFTAGDGTDDETMTFSGTIANINAALAGMLYAPTANFNGAGGFAYSVDDGSDPSPTTGNIAVTVLAVNDAPSLSLTPVVTSLKETADTSSARKVADIDVSDVDGGTNVLSLTGADAALFKIVGNDLFLKAGALLDFETNPKLDVTVVVDDGDGPGPDDSQALSIDITDVAEVITGTKGANVLVGTGAHESINGKGGDDTIKAGGGDDTVRGGAGADVVTGGAGADVFVFKPGDLPKVNYLDRWKSPLNGDHDLIRDFTPGEDKIDLSAIDANTHKDGNQKFHFEGKHELSQSRGELVYELYGSKPSAKYTIVKGDTNGDGDYDFLIVLKGHHALHASDFIL